MFRSGFSKMLFLTFPGSTVVWFEAIDLICPQREDELNRRVRCCCPESDPKPPRLPKSCRLHSVSVAFDLEVCPPRSGTDIKGGCKSQVMIHQYFVRACSQFSAGSLRFSMLTGELEPQLHLPRLQKKLEPSAGWAMARFL
eukprot:s793_g14.t1